MSCDWLAGGLASVVNVPVAAGLADVVVAADWEASVVAAVEVVVGVACAVVGGAVGVAAGGRLVAAGTAAGAGEAAAGSAFG